MSLPLLQTSPTVRLHVDSDRRLRADVVKSPAAANALQLRSGGLYAKRGQRLYGWSVTSTSFASQLANSIVLNSNVPAFLAVEYADYGGMIDLVAAPTRITIPAGGDGKWFTKATVQIIATTGAFGAPATASTMVLKNGLLQVAGEWLAMDNTAANGTANMQGYFDAVAGDYLELYARFNIATGATAPTWKFNNVSWGGFRVSE